MPTNFTDANGVPDMIMEVYDNTPANNAPAKGNDRSDLLGTISPSSAKAIDATYPRVADPDVANTGSGPAVCTYRVTYGSAEANQADMTDLILTNPTPGASEPIINHFDGLTRTKVLGDVCTVYVNHSFSGV